MMTVSNYEIQPVYIRNASQEEYVAMNRLNNVIRAEIHPDDPPVPIEEYRSQKQNIPEYLDVKYWIIWDKKKQEIIATGVVEFQRTEENQHMADFNIRVLPDFRRRGIGRKILLRIVEAAKEDHRKFLVTETESRIPGGDEFMKAIGGKKALEAHTNQLRIEDLHLELIKKWLDIAKDRSKEFTLGFWSGPYPEEKIHEVAKLYELENQQPFGDLAYDESHVTPEQLRQVEKHLFAKGDQRWTYYLVEKQTGNFVGYTETLWNPNRPEVLYQEMTGVFPEYRGKGLGRWLKAAMLDRVLRERPQVKSVRTGNADSNAAMLKINNELGYKPYMAINMWQVEVDEVQSYLARKGN
jgi:RimJ/RimL family protein N-acetyltransferase